MVKYLYIIEVKTLSTDEGCNVSTPLHLYIGKLI